MANTIRILRIDLFDNDGVGPIVGEATVEVKSDDAVTSAVAGGVVKRDTRVVALTRTAWNQLVSALRRPNDDAWPDGTIAHPIAKAP